MGQGLLNRIMKGRPPLHNQRGECGLVTCTHEKGVGQEFLHTRDKLEETSKFPFCDHKQTTKDDKRR